jgi:hypothetical protein
VRYEQIAVYPTAACATKIDREIMNTITINIRQAKLGTVLLFHLLQL